MVEAAIELVNAPALFMQLTTQIIPSPLILDRPGLDSARPSGLLRAGLSANGQ